MTPSILPPFTTGSCPARITSLSFHGLLPVLFSSILSTGAFAASASWNVDTAGNWTDGTKWTAGGPPNGAGQTASLIFDITANRTITLDAAQTIGGMVIGDPTTPFFAYTLSGASTLTTSGAVTITKSLSTTNTAKDKIAVPITLGGDLLIDQKARNGGVLEFSGVIGDDGSTRAVTIYGNGANSLTAAAVVLFSTANTYEGLTTIKAGGSGASNGAGGVLRISNSGGSVWKTLVDHSISSPDLRHGEGSSTISFPQGRARWKLPDKAHKSRTRGI